MTLHQCSSIQRRSNIWDLKYAFSKILKCIFVFLSVACNKRKREDEEETEKKVVQEGMSWWNCMMLDMPQENTRPQAVTVQRPQAVPVHRNIQQASTTSQTAAWPQQVQGSNSGHMSSR